MRSSAAGSGFVLLDTLIAVALLIAVASGVVHLFAISVAETRAARERTIATVLAAGRLEQLRGLAWDYVPAPPGGPALPRSDWVTDLSVDPPGVSGTGLMETPPGTLDTNTRGAVDYLDARGRWVGSGGSPPASAAYIRRWAIRALPANPADAVVLQRATELIWRDRDRFSAQDQDTLNAIRTDLTNIVLDGRAAFGSDDVSTVLGHAATVVISILPKGECDGFLSPAEQQQARVLERFASR